ncbi:MAG: peptide chain release factor N(5)-glutamine methyltransferase [Chloroflexi bacterium HGW-Chloroflexi-8]|jgi:release factor glutamine methyltransferase|nr:MAG: peptide chain release factor N(5)-glutamine methyltransferase [Chloroflexi bacterium HGW-Chloroflexi-8]
MTTKLGEWRLSAIRSLRPVSTEPDIEVNVVLKSVLEKDFAWILMNPDFILSSKQIDKLSDYLDRLIHRQPLSYILGNSEFYGLNFVITPNVLIPRSETEMLVEEALLWGKKQHKKIRLLDVGIGSGCIALSILKNLPGSTAVGVDISFQAIQIAKINEKRLNIHSISLINGDLAQSLHGKFDLICANLPYIPSQDVIGLVHARFEPKLALDGGINGTEIIERLLIQSKNKILRPGLLLLEIQFDQGERIADFANQIFPKCEIRILQDYSGKDRLLRVEID